MRRLFPTVMLLASTISLMAVPAKHGVWKTLSLDDGSQVQARLFGDENYHFWQSAEGTPFLLCPQSSTYQLADTSALHQRAGQRQAGKSTVDKARLNSEKSMGDFTAYTGTKKALLILANFADRRFQASHNADLYKRICNEAGFTSAEGFKGSVYDYFKAQSYGKLELTFDIAGPVTLPHNYAYYGQNDYYGYDMYVGQMVADACKAANPQVNFKNYDWDGDGYVDQVVVVYAGQGESSCLDENTVWPQEWNLANSDFGSTITLDGVRIDDFAVSNELASASQIEGIGTLCHEFSHCLGLPDMYDIQNEGNYGLGNWSVMARGSYNGDGFVPAGFTSFEKFSCGWLSPIQLNGSTSINSMQSLAQAPEAYLIRNDAYDDEYYLIENRQQTGWDAHCPSSGMLILHIDYDYNIWKHNLVNTNVTAEEAQISEPGTPTNSHQRCTIIRATSTADTYPQGNKNALTNSTSPSATLYHPNQDGQLLMSKPITGIKQNSDKTISFVFTNTFNMGTGIFGTKNETLQPANDFYDLQGHKTRHPHKGLHIFNGKLVFNK